MTLEATLRAALTAFHERLSDISTDGGRLGDGDYIAQYFQNTILAQAIQKIVPNFLVEFLGERFNIPTPLAFDDQRPQTHLIALKTYALLIRYASHDKTNIKIACDDVLRAIEEKEGSFAEEESKIEVTEEFVAEQVDTLIKPMLMFGKFPTPHAKEVVEALVSNLGSLSRNNTVWRDVDEDSTTTTPDDVIKAFQETFHVPDESNSVPIKSATKS